MCINTQDVKYHLREASNQNIEKELKKAKVWKHFIGFLIDAWPLNHQKECEDQVEP